jgi:hypothetical protein
VDRLLRVCQKGRDAGGAEGEITSEPIQADAG